MSSQFDAKGRYFARINDDGILKIWNTSSSSLEQEYVPDIHLASPCTCLQFVECLQENKNKSSPQIKKKRKSNDVSTEIVLGTTSGKLLIYSISKGDIKCTIDGDINLPVSCLSPNCEEIIYSGIDTNVVVWNIDQRILLSKWKAGNNTITAVLAVPNSKKLLTASKSIKLWNLENQTLLKSFRGHSSDVNFLHSIPNSNSESKYVISGSRNDRLLNCWNISEEVEEAHTTATLLSEDYVTDISVKTTEDGSTRLSVSIANGALHIFEVALNGRCIKPIKPKSTINVVADTGQKNGDVVPISVVSSRLQTESTVIIAYGSSVVLKFEELFKEWDKKITCLIREHPHAQKKDDVQTDKVITPLVGKNATYLTPFSNVAGVTKRKLGGTPEVPMERRLENLTFDKADGPVPKSNNMAHLLLQGLKSKDKNIIRTVLRSTNEQTIRNTIRRLPINIISELVKQLEILIEGNNTNARAATLWLKILLEVHLALLISNPDLPVMFGHIRNYIKNRLHHLSESRKFKTKLDIMLSRQVDTSSHNDEEDEDEALIFNDRDSDSSSDEVVESEDTNEEECSDLDVTMEEM